MSEITYLPGDATQPQAKGMAIIAHVCNDLGGWGKGFVLAISKRWNGPETQYRDWHRHRSANDFGLGAVQFVHAATDVWVANMVGQRGIQADSHGPPVRYQAIEQCLRSVSTQAIELGASVHMPRIGCGLAGGKWDRVEPLLMRTLCSANVPVYVYDFD